MTFRYGRICRTFSIFLKSTGASKLQAKVVIPMHYATAAGAARAARSGAGGQAGRQGAPGAPGAAAPARSGSMMTGIDEFLNMLDPSVKAEQAAHQITLVSGKLPAQRTVMVMKCE
jgi:hypothetical protein